MNKFKIYTDGSCLRNPGAGGWAAVILSENNKKIEISGGSKYTTNNQMELMAAIAALEKMSPNNAIELFTDSNYLKNAFTKNWISKWKQNGWKTSSKNLVLNRDLWIRLDKLISKRAVKFNWIKGHSGNTLNERCDKLARQMAEKFQKLEINPRKKIKPTQLNLFG